MCAAEGGVDGGDSVPTQANADGVIGVHALHEDTQLFVRLRGAWRDAARCHVYNVNPCIVYQQPRLVRPPH